MSIKPIKFVKSLYYANKPLAKKTEKTMVELPCSLEDDIYNKIAPQYNRMEYVANVYNIPFRFAQKGKSVLANFGTKTAIFPQNAKAEEVNTVIDGLIDHASKYLR